MRPKGTSTYQILGQARVGPAKGRTGSAQLPSVDGHRDKEGECRRQCPPLCLDTWHRPDLIFPSCGRLPPRPSRPQRRDLTCAQRVKNEPLPGQLGKAHK